MAQLMEKHALPRVNFALVLGVFWGSLAIAAAIYDIGRWFNTW